MATYDTGSNVGVQAGDGGADAAKWHSEAGYYKFCQYRYRNAELAHIPHRMLRPYPSRMMQATVRCTHNGDNMLGKIYEKTDKRREEIATRKNRMPAKLRALLLLIDGQRSLETLASNFGDPELTAENAAFLLRADLIALVARVPEPVAPSAPRATVPVPATAPPEPAPDPVNMHDIYSSRRRY